MEDDRKGHLILIGGAEDKTGDSEILRQAPELLGKEAQLTVLTTATEHPEEAGRKYREVFRRLGIRSIQVLHVDTREDANNPDLCEKVGSSDCIFLTGGDQLRLTSILGGTEMLERFKQVFQTGGLIMGTSAGASAMSCTMIVNGDDHEPAKKCTLKMAPGLGLVSGVLIDQHFDQRGRFGRLLCGVAENPDALGLGIDEDTAVKLCPDGHFEVLGSNAVTVLDGRTIQNSNVSELNQNEVLAVLGVTVHVLPRGFGFELKERKVIRLTNET